MFELWVKDRETKRTYKIKDFWDERNIHFEIDQVDRDKCEWVMVIVKGQSGCVFFKEFEKKEKILRK